MKFQQMNVSLKILGECGAAFHPVTAVQILDAVDRSDFGAVDVAANHPVHLGLPGDVHHALLKAGDVANRALGLELQVCRHRPIAESQAAADPVEVQIEFEDPIIKP